MNATQTTQGNVSTAPHARDTSIIQRKHHLSVFVILTLGHHLLSLHLGEEKP